MYPSTQKVVDFINSAGQDQFLRCEVKRRGKHKAKFYNDLKLK